VQLWAPAGGAVWNAPTVDPRRQTVSIGTGDATTFPAAKTSDAVMAFDMSTGAVKWSYQVHENDSFLVGCQGDNRTENCPQVQGPDWDIPASVILRDIPGASTPRRRPALERNQTSDHAGIFVSKNCPFPSTRW
jgi:polyvinyl alcohol dehydrogenase (cytochrome)